MLILGCLFGIGVTFAFLGMLWLPLSALGLLLVVAISFLASKGRILDFESWLIGASGESQVRQTLRDLEPLGYSVIGDVDMGRGNVDHVVVGPTGVFAIETKNRGGRVVAGGDGLLNEWHQADARKAVREAIWVRHRAGVRFVEAFLVYPTAKVEPDVLRLPNVTVMSLPRLNAEITSRYGSLPGHEIDRIKRVLSDAPDAASAAGDLGVGR
ncbi:MAG: nuclease-related domain-containing protein [Actinomycetota bacterium]